VVRTHRTHRSLPDVAALRHYCKEHGLTLSNIFQLAWSLVLATFTGTETVLFGYLASGRDAPIAGVDAIIGPLVDMLICRMDITQSGNVLQAFERIQDDALSSISHRQSSLAEIVDAVNPGSSALFNTLLSVNSSRSWTTGLPEGLTVTQIDGADPTEV
jgi:non-ribosomal peptide synthetase component F